MVIVFGVSFDQCSSSERMFRSDIVTRTRDPDQTIVEITKLIKPKVERRERKAYKIFGPVSYYKVEQWTILHESVTVFWIKIRSRVALILLKNWSKVVNTKYFWNYFNTS